MIKTRDEILLDFVRNLSENENLFKQSQDPPPLPKKKEEKNEFEQVVPPPLPMSMPEPKQTDVEDIPEISSEEIEEVNEEPIELGEHEFEEIVEETKEPEEPIKIERDQALTKPDDEMEKIWLDPNAGSAAWAAENYPYIYFRGKIIPDYSYFRRSENRAVTKKLLDDVINNDPEKFFSWGLRRLNLDRQYRETAAKNFIEKDPEKALIMGIHEQIPDLESLPLLWQKNVDVESKNGFKFPGIIRRRMKGLLDALTKNEKYSNFVRDSIYGTDVGRKIADVINQGYTVFPTQISSRENPRGSIRWLAEKYPQIYLKGVDEVGSHTGFVRDERDNQATEEAMNKLIQEDPIKYFQWGLRMKKNELDRYLKDAAKSAIKKDPYGALMYRVYKQGPEAHKYLLMLWNNLMKVADMRTDNLGDNFAVRFPKHIFNNMKSLAGEIARSHPQFYLKQIKEPEDKRQMKETEEIKLGRRSTYTPRFSTTRFTGWAMDAFKN